MNTINQLLKDVPTQQINAYQVYLHKHIKLLMTSINKARVQDLTEITKKKDNCIKKCYQSNLRNIQRDMQQQNFHQLVENIRDCKHSCGEQKRAVKKYLDDINYYSLLKLRGCTKKCPGDQKSPEFNKCWWSCYNKLDRRYKRYWQEQREKVQAKFIQ